MGVPGPAATIVAGSAAGEVDEIDLLRASLYDLLANLLGRAPTTETLSLAARLQGDVTPLGNALQAVAHAAKEAQPAIVSREYFNLFVGIGRGELLPYASYYLTGFLNERPLAALRADLARLGIERAAHSRDPEDHIAFVLETMANLASARLEAETGSERRFFELHLKPWAERFFADLEGAGAAEFYRPVGALGRLYMEIEAEAFAIDA